MVKIDFRCPACDSLKFSRATHQLHSFPPWDIFQCNVCKRLWAINQQHLIRLKDNILTVKDGVIYREDWLPDMLLVLDTREEINYA